MTQKSEAAAEHEKQPGVASAAQQKSPTTQSGAHKSSGRKRREKTQPPTHPLDRRTTIILGSMSAVAVISTAIFTLLAAWIGGQMSYKSTDNAARIAAQTGADQEARTFRRDERKDAYYKSLDALQRTLDAGSVIAAAASFYDRRSQYLTIDMPADVEAFQSANTAAQSAESLLALVGSNEIRDIFQKVMPVTTAMTEAATRIIEIWSDKAIGRGAEMQKACDDFREHDLDLRVIVTTFTNQARNELEIK